MIATSNVRADGPNGPAKMLNLGPAQYYRLFRRPKWRENMGISRNFPKILRKSDGCF